MPPRTRRGQGQESLRGVGSSSGTGSYGRSESGLRGVVDAALGAGGASTGANERVRTDSDGGTPRQISSKGKEREPEPILALFNQNASAEDELDETEEWHDSLDLATNDLEESHFLGSSALQDLTLLTDTPLGSSGNPQSFRQVSKDPKTHVFFVRSPAFVYGKGLMASQTIFGRVCEMLGAEMAEALMQKFLQTSLPAFPLLNTMRLLAACRSQAEAGPLPHALLCGVMGHSIGYIPEVKHLFSKVWKEVVSAEDEEYKQPRLQVIQLALISLSTRPSQAHAVNAMSLARSVSIAHMIGLHLDCSEWRLPRWERSVRKRSWWALLILDKWISMAYGRPSLIHKNNRSVPLPTLDDTDWGEFQPDEDSFAEESMASFIGHCEIALVIEIMLDKFYSQEAQRRTSAATVDDLRELSGQLDALQARIPTCLKWAPGEKAGSVATGIRCFQLTLLGVRVLIARLYVTSHQDQQQIRPAEAQSMDVALKLCEHFVVFMEELRPETDYETFWLPHCAFLVSTCLGLLLRIAVRVYLQQSRPEGLRHSISQKLLQWSPQAADLVKRLVANLRQAKQMHKWEVAETAMLRGNELLRSTATVLPELAALSDDPVRATQTMPVDTGLPDLGLFGDPSLFMGDWSWALNLGNLEGGQDLASMGLNGGMGL
ncbi:hypothetical protein IAT38_003047 [Cryptococcus sp. DSM 104549]